MNKVIRGRAFVYGANVDTDRIYPGRFLDITDPKEIAKHAMEGVDEAFRGEVRAGDVIIASTNFGCGSSREHAAIALKEAGISAIIADSFARIFYRNAINLGIAAVICPGISNIVSRGDCIAIELTAGKVTNESTGVEIQGQPLSDYVLNILAHGGVKELIKCQFET